jgi:hypothetical protein
MAIWHVTLFNPLDVLHTAFDPAVHKSPDPVRSGLPAVWPRGSVVA